MTLSKLCFTLLLAAGPACIAVGQTETASATLTGVQSGSLYDYTLTLDNTGPVPIGTFWYAWVPGAFFLPSTPASATAPTGWNADIFHSYSIQYTASSSADYLAPGSSLNFSFTSTDTPAALAGYSPHDPSDLVGTSYIYSAGPLSDSGYEFVVQSVPEPSALGWLAAGFLGLAIVQRRKWRRAGASLL
jgi:hypothetical protein